MKYASGQIHKAFIRQYKREQIRKSVEKLKNANSAKEVNDGFDSATDEF